MSGGQKPAAKLAIKPAGGGERVYIAAAWRRDDGRMGGLRLDRKVRQLAVQMDDGTIHRVTIGADGKASHFIDLFMEDERSSQSSGGGGRQQRSAPADDFGGDGGGSDFGDIPFDRIRGEVL